MLRLIIIGLAFVALATTAVQGTSSTAGNLRRAARQVGSDSNVNPNPSASAPRDNKDRSIYARRASGISGVVSDVYEVFVGPSNYTYTKSAVVVLNADNNSGVKGLITMTQDGNHSPVKISGNITGLSPGKHGFHVHQSGNTAEGCKSTGGHFNPFMQPHGSPSDDKRHIGDLGNILADEDGNAVVSIEDSKISLSGTASIIGRGVVVHAGEDDLGKGGDEGSLKTGNAGGRVACGVIAIN